MSCNDYMDDYPEDQTCAFCDQSTEFDCVACGRPVCEEHYVDERWEPHYSLSASCLCDDCEMHRVFQHPSQDLSAIPKEDLAAFLNHALGHLAGDLYLTLNDYESARSLLSGCMFDLQIGWRAA